MRALSLSTSWNANRHKEGLAMVEEMCALGFSRIELGHNIRYSLWPGVLEAHRRGLVGFSSLHNFCPVPMGVMKPSPNCFELTDPRPILRQQAINATIETIHHAARLGAPVVVMHLGSSGQAGFSRKLERLFEGGHFLSRNYVKVKLDAVQERRKLFPAVWDRLRESLKPIVEAAVKTGVKLGFENRERFEEFPDGDEFAAVLEAFPDPHVGYWHDFGHAARMEYLGWCDHRAQLARYAPRLIGCHVQDCLPPNLDHLPLGHGEVPFADLLPLVPEGAVAVLELSPRATAEEIVTSVTLWNTFFKTSGVMPV